MFARKLNGNENYFSRRNMAVAFEGEFELDKELEKAQTEEADPHADHWAAFVEGEERPVASLVMNKLEVQFDGHLVKLAGVGGVATLPTYRRGGAIRACMQASFRDLYDDGYTLAALYPFKMSYYRKFGFENGAHAILWTIPLPELDLPDQGGRVYQLFPEDDHTPLLKVYNAYYENTNLAAVRETYDKSLEKLSHVNSRCSIFVWEDENGEPGAFLIGSRDGDILDCRTDFTRKNALLFRDARALRAMLHFVHTAFLANYDSIRFMTPDYIDVLGILPEVGNFDEGKLIVNGMLRVMNVEKALKLCRCQGEGTVTVQIEDKMLPENNDTFRVSFAPGRENLVERVKDAPDLSLAIGDFSALLCGVKAVKDLPWMPGVQVKNEEAPLSGLFYRKRCHILNLF